MYLARTAIKFILLFLILFVNNVYAQKSAKYPQPQVGFIIRSSYPIELPIQNMLTGYLGERYYDNLKKRLLQIDENGILQGFLHRPGKQVWIGEHVGKYLESAANTWEITRNSELKEQMDRVANALISSQLSDGYLGTYLPNEYWTEWDVWVHKYDLYGLLGYYRVTGSKKALDAAKKIGDLLCRTFGDNPGQRDIIRSGTHVGMAATSVLDPMADLYRWTGNQKYLNFCHYLIRSYNHPGGPAIVETLLQEKEVNKVANGKAYEMLSNLVGIVKLYRLTGEKQLLTAAKIAFDDIVSKRLYISGTASDHEHFKEDFVLPAGNNAHMGEGCVTVTWMQFNMQLFAVSGDLKYFDEIEKSVYNQLLAAQNPENGCVSYYTPLMGKKPYGCDINCCLSSVPRGIALIPFLNYGKVNNAPTVLLYEAATIRDTITTLNHLALPLQLTIESQFPQDGRATIHLKLPHTATFALQLRVPSWCTGFRASINGRNYSGKADDWVKIERHWNDEDQVTVSFDMPVNVLQGGESYLGSVAFKRGPQVLSLDSSLNTSINADIPAIKLSNPSKLTLQNTTEKLPANWIGKQAYTLTVSTDQGQTKTLTFVPFAEASQTGAKADVWVPITKSKE